MITVLVFAVLMAVLVAAVGLPTPEPVRQED